MSAWKSKLKPFGRALFIYGSMALLLGAPLATRATEFSSSSFEVHDPVIDGGTGNTSSGSFQVRQSLGQPAIGRSTSGSFQLLGGFQYYYTVLANVLSATAGNGQVNLSWTVPQTFLGASVNAYEVGTGTASGVYTFEPVGNVTSFSKTGLSNGTPYFFKIKALAPGGTFLVFSNEATATPVAATPPPTGGGGGGTPVSYYGSLDLSGYSQPNSQVHILVNNVELITVTAGNNGTWTADLPSLYAGANKISIYYTDTEGRSSSKYSASADIAVNERQSVGNIVLPPTLSVNPQVIHLGDTVKIEGAAPAGANIDITLKSKRKTKTVSATADNQGRWTIETSTKDLTKDAYTVTARAKLQNFTSIESLEVALWIDVPPTVPPTAGVGKCGDYNNDGRINLIDFSILIYWFGKPNVPPHIDCNRDGKADLIDFSILMYYWTG